MSGGCKGSFTEQFLLAGCGQSGRAADQQPLLGRGRAWGSAHRWQLVGGLERAPGDDGGGGQEGRTCLVTAGGPEEDRPPQTQEDRPRQTACRPQHPQPRSPPSQPLSPLGTRTHTLMHTHAPSSCSQTCTHTHTYRAFTRWPSHTWAHTHMHTQAQSAKLQLTGLKFPSA